MKKAMFLLAVAAITFSGCKKCYKCNIVGTYYSNGQTQTLGTYETCSKEDLEQQQQVNAKWTDYQGQEVGTKTYVCD